MWFKENDDNIGKESDERNWMGMSDENDSYERYQIDKNDE